MRKSINVTIFIISNIIPATAVAADLIGAYTTTSSSTGFESLTTEDYGYLGAKSSVDFEYLEPSWRYFRGESSARSGDPIRPLAGPLLAANAGIIAENISGLQQDNRGQAQAFAQFTDKLTITPTMYNESYTLRISYKMHGLVHLDESGLYGLYLRLIADGKTADDHVGTFNRFRYNNSTESLPTRPFEVSDQTAWDSYMISRDVLRPELYELTGYSHLDLRVDPGPVNVVFSLALDVFVDSGASRYQPSNPWINADNTAGLVSISVIDSKGIERTPESLGWGIVFASGMVSPNITAVPEPSSIILCAGGSILSCLASGWRRRRAA